MSQNKTSFKPLVGSFSLTHLQSFTLPIQAAAESLVVGRQHVQLRPQGVMGCGRGFGYEAVDAVGQQLDLELLGMDLLLCPLVGRGDQRKFYSMNTATVIRDF